MRKEHTFYDPLLNQFVFDCLFMADKEHRAHLKGYELTAMKTATKAKNFAAKTTLDQKIALLSRLGIPFFYGFGIQDSAILQKMFKGYEETGLMDTVKQTLKHKVFIVTSRETATFLGLMANAVHSDAYVMNRHYLRLGEHVRKLKQDDQHPSDAAIDECLAASRDLARIGIQYILLSKYVDEFNINEVSLMVLMHLFSKKSFDVPEADLHNLLCPMYVKAKVTNAIKGLVSEKMAERSYREKKTNRVTITAYGIEVMSRIQKKVMNLATNF